MKNRFTEIKNTIKHRKEVQRIAKEFGYSFPFHDFIKMINIAVFGDFIATKIHRTFSSHHAHKKLNGKRYIKNKVEAVIDWESARFTKPDKPLNAYQTWKKYYGDIDMLPTLKMLGLDK